MIDLKQISTADLWAYLQFVIEQKTKLTPSVHKAYYSNLDEQIEREIDYRIENILYRENK